MKKILFIAAMLMCLMNNSIQAQDVVREGKTFTMVKTDNAQETGFTMQIGDAVYPIYINPKTGRCWIIRVSKKTNNEYKQYCCEEVCREICKELGIEYKEK